MSTEPMNTEPEKKQTFTPEEKEELRKDIKNFQQWAMLLGGLSLVVGALICLAFLLLGKIPIR